MKAEMYIYRKIIESITRLQRYLIDKIGGIDPQRGITLVNDKKLFKGNKCNINTWQNSKYDKGITWNNIIYNNYIQQMYSILADKTYMVTYINVNRAKWVRQKLDLIDFMIDNNKSNCESLTGSMVIFGDVKLKVTFNTYQWTEFELRSEVDGLKFINNWSQIELIRKYKTATKDIYKRFKDTSPEIIASYCKIEDNQIVMDLNKLIK